MNFDFLLNSFFKLVDEGSPLTLRLLFRFWPNEVLARAMYSDAMHPKNVPVVWGYPVGDVDAEIEDLVDAVGEKIERAPAPYGGDDYVLVITGFSNIEGENFDGTLDEEIDLRIGDRKAIAHFAMRGNRYDHWKKGEGKDSLRSALKKIVPSVNAPVLIIAVGFEGRALARVISKIKNKPAQDYFAGNE
jgi:hypothetical protein